MNNYVETMGGGQRRGGHGERDGGAEWHHRAVWLINIVEKKKFFEHSELDETELLGIFLAKVSVC